MGVVTETGVETISVASVIDAGLFSSTLVDAGLGLIFNTPVGAGVVSKTPIGACVISNAGVTGRVGVDVDRAAIVGGSTGMNQLGPGCDEGPGSGTGTTDDDMSGMQKRVPFCMMPFVNMCQTFPVLLSIYIIRDVHFKQFIMII